MKLNSFLTIIPFIFLTSKISFPQNIQIYCNSGLNLPLSSKYIVSYTDNSIEFIKSNYGKGFSIKAGGSYFIIENMGVDFNVSYLFSSEKTFKGNIWDTKEYFKNTNISLNPSLIIQSKIGNLLPYLKFGFSINFVTVDIYEDNLDFPSYEYSTDYTFGFNASLGLKIPLNKTLMVMTEATLSSFTLYADKVIYNWEINGVRNSKEYDLKTKFGGGGYANLEASRDYPFRFIEINLGIQYCL